MEGTSNSQSKNKATNKRWRPVESQYFLKFMASQVERGLKTDKSFKESAFVAAVQALSVEFKREYTLANMQNHYRTFKRKWAIIKRLKELSGVGWDEASKKITMGHDEFMIYIKSHPECEPYINKSIEDYDLLDIVCGNDQATGHFAKQSFDNLGQDPNTQGDEQDDMDVSLHDNSTSFPFFNLDETATFPTQTPPMNTPPDNSPSESSTRENNSRGKKRSLSNEAKAMQGMTASVDKLAIAINTNKEVAMASNLVNECKTIMQYGYTIQDVHRLFMKLNADNTKARGFLGVNDEMLRRLQVEEYIGLPEAQE